MNYSHIFVKKKEFHPQSVYICKKCHIQSGYEEWSMKRIAIYLKKITFHSHYRSVLKQYKSSYKVRHDKSRGYGLLSSWVGIRKGKNYYFINPYTGKKLYKLPCSVSGNEMLVREIIR